MIRFALRQAVVAAKDRKGVTAAEYAVLAVAIITAVGLAVAGLSTNLVAKFAAIAS